MKHESKLNDVGATFGTSCGSATNTHTIVATRLCMPALHTYLYKLCPVHVMGYSCGPAPNRRGKDALLPVVATRLCMPALHACLHKLSPAHVMGHLYI